MNNFAVTYTTPIQAGWTDDEVCRFAGTEDIPRSIVVPGAAVEHLVADGVVRGDLVAAAEAWAAENL